MWIRSSRWIRSGVFWLASVVLVIGLVLDVSSGAFAGAAETGPSASETDVKTAQTGGSKERTGGSVELNVSSSTPTMLADQKSTNYARIELKGGPSPDAADAPPINVAIVIDTSGSMSDKKIKQAKQAAKTAIQQLRDDDIISVVLYSAKANVLVPATKAVDREWIAKKIDDIRADGNTALFEGVTRAAAEVRKFLDDDAVNRVILLSDGKANVGPSSPRDLARLGASLVKEGISVTTLGLGLGYNEDLMSKLASASSGNHVFIEEAEDLVAVFKTEFKDLLSVVAGDFKIRAQVGDSVRPVRVLGTDADIVGQQITIPLAQLYSRQSRYFIVELEVAASEADAKLPLMQVDVSYKDLVDGKSHQLSEKTSVTFSDDPKLVQQRRDLETWAYCNVQLANEQNQRACELRDAGKIDEAADLLKQISTNLKPIMLQCEAQGVTAPIEEVRFAIDNNAVQAEWVKQSNWGLNRKKIQFFRSAAQDNRIENYKAQSGNQSNAPEPGSKMNKERQ